MVSEVNGPGSGSLPSTAATQRAEQPGGQTPAASGGTGSVTDAVSMTHSARALQALDQAIAQVPEVDMQRVESLRAAVASGTLEIDPGEVAQKLIDFESSHPDASGS